MAISQRTVPQTNAPDTGRIWRAGGIAIVAALAGNLVGWLLLRGLADPVFPPMATPFPIIIFTAIGVGGGVVLFWLLARFTRQPYRLWNAIAVIFTIVSCIPNVLAALNPASFPFPGATAAGFLALIAFHIIAAAVAIGVMNTQTRPRD